ncbi:kinase-like domain-containing protein [Kalaharituber pfeilii]|nr:kinase-like domain-containing protein [Kalaharituber pfeilii]
MSSPDYEDLEVIGKGSFGNIRKVRRRSDGVIMARKEISYAKMEAKERDQLQGADALWNIVQCWIMLIARLYSGVLHIVNRKASKYCRIFPPRTFKKGENAIHVSIQVSIVRGASGSELTTEVLNSYMEYCGGGDLAGLVVDVREKRAALSEDLIWSIFTQLVCALYRCHYGIDPPHLDEQPPNTYNKAPPPHMRGKTVIHRDLKPENVFLDENNSVKLGDFGLSKMLASEQQLAMTYVGTPLYMSPELFSDTPYNLKTDIWSLGCIIYELCTLQPPFTAKSLNQLVNTIKSGRFEPIPNHYSAELRSVIEQCLRGDAKERPETAQLLHHPMVRSYRRQQDTVIFRRDLQRRENQLNMLENRLAAKERDIIAAERELIARERNLALKEREIMANDHALMVKEREMNHYLEERSRTLRDQINAEVRNEWKIKAEAEVQQHMEQVQMDLQARFEFELNQQLEAQLAHRLEAEVDRRIKDLNLVPAHTLSLSSTNSSTSSYSSAPTSISSFHSPSRNSFLQLMPDSPADIDMASPLRDLSPQKHHIFEERPPALDLHQKLPNELAEDKDILIDVEVPSQRECPVGGIVSDSAPHGSTSMEDIDNEAAYEIVHSLKKGNIPVLNRYATTESTGSPIKRSSQAGIRRTQTTTGVNLFPPSSRPNSRGSSESHENISMVKTATLNSCAMQDHFSRVVGLARAREEQMKQAMKEQPKSQAGYPEEPPVWDRGSPDAPSPFIKRTRNLS